MKVAGLLLAHPAFILRGQYGRRHQQLRALKRLRRYLDTGADPPEPLEPDLTPHQQLPSADEVCSWLYSLPTTSPEGVACDVEAAGHHLRLIGFARFSDECYMPVLLRGVGGSLAYPYRDLQRMVRATYWALGNPQVPKWFHNGYGYDIPTQLEATGFAVRGFAGDTLLMQRYAAPESPADLQYLGITYGNLGSWKHWLKTRDDDTEENK